MTDIVSLIELASSDMDLRTRVDAIQEIAKQATMETPEAIEFLNRVAKYELGAELAAYGQTSLYHLKEKYPGLKNLEGPLGAETSAYERLSDDSFEQRLRAIEYFECEGITSSVPELIKRLKIEHHPHVISKLTKTLGLLGAEFDNEEIFNVLVPFLKHKDERIRANTIQGMGGLQSNRKIPMLLDALMLDKEERVQNMASVVLSLENVETTLLLLKEKLESGDPEVFEMAMAALKEIERPEAWALYDSYKENVQKIKTEQAFREAIDLDWDEEEDEIPDFSAEMDDAEIFEELPEIKVDSSEAESSTPELIPVESLVEEQEPIQAFPSPPVSAPPPPVFSPPPLVSAPPPPVSSPPPPQSSPVPAEAGSHENEQVQYAYNPAMSETYQHPPEEEQSLSSEEDSVPEFKIFDKPKPARVKPSKPKKKSRRQSGRKEPLYDGFFGFVGYFLRKLFFAGVLGGLAVLYLRYEKEIVKFSYVEIESYKAGRGILFAKLPPPKKKQWVSRKDDKSEPETAQTVEGQTPQKTGPQDQQPGKSEQPPEKTQTTDGKASGPEIPHLQIDSIAARPHQPPTIKLSRRKGKKDLSSLEGFTRHTYSNGDRYIGTFRSGKRNGEGSLFYMNGEVYVGQWKNNQFDGQGTYTWPGGDRFVGSFMDGKRNGKGVFNWVNGESFEGEYAQGMRSGIGKMSFSNGEIYEGEWKEDLFHGAGVYTFSDGSIYEGNYEEGQVHGEGRYVYSNGRIYEGEFQAGKRQGQGRMIFPNGELYEGAWHEDDYHGKGAYRWASGDWYRGDWQNGKMHGSGLYHWVNGDEYEGEYIQDKPNGRGELMYHNEGRYVGRFKDGLREGEGTYYAPVGYSYSGSWKSGKRHGLGITKWSDGEGYRGQWKHGLEHGMGRYTWAGGEKYIGQWRDGYKNGLGTFISSDGQIREGLWKDDQFVGSIPGDIQEWKKELKFMNFFFERTKENRAQPTGS
jgi:hypothetical protein